MWKRSKKKRNKSEVLKVETNLRVVPAEMRETRPEKKAEREGLPGKPKPSFKPF